MSHELVESEAADPIGFIEAMKAECWQLGRNDAEIPNLTKLQEDFREKRISAVEAVRLAGEIRYGKQDH